MSPRVGLVVAFGSCWSADAARSPFREKEVVAGAHPYLKRRFAEAGRLVPADFEAASRLPFRKPSLRSGPSRLGGKNYDITAAQCANYTHTDACYDGDASVIDDDAVLGAPSDPGACARCGYFPEGAPSTFMDCVECADDGDTIVVLYDDCTGLCADADTAAYFAALGFGDLDTSACVLYPNCYDDFVDYATDGTIDQYVSNDDGGASYSYSFSYGGYVGACSENCATCDGPGSADCASCDEGYELTGDTDGDGFGFCTAVAVPTATYAPTIDESSATPSIAPTALPPGYFPNTLASTTCDAAHYHTVSWCHHNDNGICVANQGECDALSGRMTEGVGCNGPQGSGCSCCRRASATSSAAASPSRRTAVGRSGPAASWRTPSSRTPSPSRPRPT